jgi:non-ribosomal peptide synthetase component F
MAGADAYMHTEERTATGVRLLHSIFELQAGRTPHATALEVPPRRAGERRRRLTYAELDARAEALARRLSAWVTG